MNARTLALSAALLTLAVPAGPRAADAADKPGSADHPLFNRIPGFFISKYVAADFDTVKFRDGRSETPVEGRAWSIEYSIQQGRTPPSTIEILRNFQNAARAIGGKILHDSPAETTFRITKKGGETWVRVAAWSGGKSYSLRIIEKAAINQQVAANADALASGLAASGHAEVGGILFDTGSAAIKPESAEAIAEVAKLLQRDPGLAIHVVGHTDNVGDPASNVKLSNERAAAVVAALTGKHGIAATRLGAFGAGPFAPVASNATDEGRTSNRRVEIVAR